MSTEAMIGTCLVGLVGLIGVSAFVAICASMLSSKRSQEQERIGWADEKE